MKTQKDLNFYCKHDHIPLDVSFHKENSGACFGLGDHDNDQSKQVLLSYADTRRLLFALAAFLEVKITD